MLTQEDADLFAERLAGATQRVVQDYKIGDVVHEEPFSDQLCGRLKETLEGFETPNIRWQADVALSETGRGRFSARSLTKTREEPEFGADLIMALDVDTPSYTVRKGFLAQAKRLEHGDHLNPQAHRDLLGQCEKMLTVTPASIVFLYSTGGVHVVPAAAVLSIRHQDLWKIATYDIEILYKDFVMCWFGDTRLQATDHRSLEGLRLLADVPAAVRILGRQRIDKAPARRKRMVQ